MGQLNAFSKCPGSRQRPDQKHPPISLTSFSESFQGTDFSKSKSTKHKNRTWVLSCLAEVSFSMPVEHLGFLFAFPLRTNFWIQRHIYALGGRWDDG